MYYISLELNGDAFYLCLKAINFPIALQRAEDFCQGLCYRDPETVYSIVEILRKPRRVKYLELP